MPATISFSTTSSSSTTMVPGPSAKLESTCTRTRSFIASSTERVCNTFAPTEASSSISS
jgi:hypothetical protein